MIGLHPKLVLFELSVPEGLGRVNWRQVGDGQKQTLASSKEMA
jgi:hypothetical protein